MISADRRSCRGGGTGDRLIHDLQWMTDLDVRPERLEMRTDLNGTARVGHRHNGCPGGDDRPCFLLAEGRRHFWLEGGIQATRTAAPAPIAQVYWCGPRLPQRAPHFWADALRVQVMAGIVHRHPALNESCAWRVYLHCIAYAGLKLQGTRMPFGIVGQEFGIGGHVRTASGAVHHSDVGIFELRDAITGKCPG